MAGLFGGTGACFRQVRHLGHPLRVRARPLMSLHGTVAPAGLACIRYGSCSNGYAKFRHEFTMLGGEITPARHVSSASAAAAAGDGPEGKAGDQTSARIELAVADPQFLLNQVAHLYKHTARVLMEYVDNALDDAEVGDGLHEELLLLQQACAHPCL